MISVIIPTAGNNPERIINLQETLQCLRNQSYSDWELIIVEQSLDGNFYNDQIPCDQYIPIQDPENRGFNLGWVNNVGAGVAKGNRLVIMNGDIVFADGLLESVANFKGAPFFIASTYTIWTTRKQKEEFLKSRDLTALLDISDVPESPFLDIWATNLAIAYDRDWYLNTFGGYLENFFRWGWEEIEAVNRILNILEIRNSELEQIKGTGIAHLFHTNRDQRSHMKNRKIFTVFRCQDPKVICTALQAKGVGNPKLPNPISVPTKRRMRNIV